jgi:glycine/D-amino acid oxidase-like deaminating enzyme
VLPALDRLHVRRAWASLNIHHDRGPVVCATPGVPGMFQAVTSNGATLGPLVGRMVAEAICRGAALPRAFGLA